MKPSRVTKIGAEQDLRESSLSHPSPPRPNLKEMAERLRKAVKTATIWPFTHMAIHPEFLLSCADTIDSLLSELSQARNNALEEAAKVADDFSAIEHRKATQLFHREGEGRHRHASDVADDIATNIRAMRGNAE